MRAVVERLRPREVEYRRVTDEDEYFPLPRELRDLIRALDVLVGATTGRTGGSGAPGSDRSHSAADVLAGLDTAEAVE